MTENYILSPYTVDDADFSDKGCQPERQEWKSNSQIFTPKDVRNRGPPWTCQKSARKKPNLHSLSRVFVEDDDQWLNTVFNLEQFVLTHHTFVCNYDLILLEFITVNKGLPKQIPHPQVSICWHFFLTLFTDPEYVLLSTQCSKFGWQYTTFEQNN